MSAKSINYYDSMSSPWTYLGHLRFVELCRRFDLAINHKPMDLLKVTQTRSGIGSKQNQRETLRSLGLKRINDVVVKEDRPEIRGMIQTVTHLVKVEEVD